MPQVLTQLEQVTDLDGLLAESHGRPVVLFKHSRSCGTSAWAFDELQQHLQETATEARYVMVTVQTHREVSRAVAAALGVRHETPQVIVVRDGRAVWTASHHRVTAAELGKALARSPAQP